MKSSRDGWQGSCTAVGMCLMPLNGPLKHGSDDKLLIVPQLEQKTDSSFQKFEKRQNDRASKQSAVPRSHQGAAWTGGSWGDSVVCVDCGAGSTTTHLRFRSLSCAGPQAVWRVVQGRVGGTASRLLPPGVGAGPPQSLRVTSEP